MRTYKHLLQTIILRAYYFKKNIRLDSIFVLSKAFTNSRDYCGSKDIIRISTKVPEYVIKDLDSLPGLSAINESIQFHYEIQQNYK